MVTDVRRWVATQNKGGKGQRDPFDCLLLVEFSSIAHYISIVLLVVHVCSLSETIRREDYFGETIWFCGRINVLKSGRLMG